MEKKARARCHCICRHASTAGLQLAGIELQDGIFMERYMGSEVGTLRTAPNPWRSSGKKKRNLNGKHAYWRDWEWGGIGNGEGLGNRRGLTKSLKVSAFKHLKQNKTEPRQENLCPETKIQGPSPLTKLVRKGQGFGDKTKTQLSKLG